MIKFVLYLFIFLFLSSAQACSQSRDNHLKSSVLMTYKKLTAEEERVILYKGTETPFTGKYEHFNEQGTYVCKQCGTSLYRSADKFDAQCGWPSFDDEIEGAVRRVPDADGRRTEIVCASCSGHLGHVFLGEGFTDKNTRHCVNSISLDFVSAENEFITDTAIFAGGCFWGVEFYMKKIPGVLSTEVGYTGGHKENPTYQEVCDGKTGHYEAIEVVFNPSQTNFETIARIFFETHDPTHWNHQGPDWGEQYRSAVFYRDTEQKRIIEMLIAELKTKGFRVVTEVKPSGKFWKAENYHQDYYDHKGQTPYCHGYVKRF
jgi:peptide methionine sulfoxide reductase msrA/msrB